MNAFFSRWILGAYVYFGLLTPVGVSLEVSK